MENEVSNASVLLLCLLMAIPGGALGWLWTCSYPEQEPGDIFGCLLNILLLVKNVIIAMIIGFAAIAALYFFLRFVG